MSAQLAAEAPLTLADLARLPDDGRRHELVEGSLVMTPAPGARHQAVATNLVVALAPTVRSDQRVTHGVGVHDPASATETYLVPDVAVVDRAVQGLRCAPSEVSAVMEVVSPSSRVHDRFTKAQLHAAMGIPEYWVIDPEAGTVTIHDLDVVTRQYVLRLTVAEDEPVPGIEVSLRELSR